MKASDVFPGSYLKADDLGQSTPTVTIMGVKTEKVGDDSKRVVYFQGKEKGLVLNRTNWNMIAEITGQDDDENWKGHKVKLYVARVDYQGKRVPAIRVDYPPKDTQPQAQPVRHSPMPPDDDDSIPF